MSKASESGYAMVAVLVVIAILTTMAALSTLQLQSAARIGRLDRAGNAAYYQAIGGLNRVWASIRAGHVDLSPHGAGGCKPPAHPGNEDAVVGPSTHSGDVLNHRVWVYQTWVCDAETRPSVLQVNAGKSLPAQHYHFVYTWTDKSGRQTRPSPAGSVQVTGAGNLPAFFPPTSDPNVNKPWDAVSYRMYVAVTPTANPSPPPVDTASGSYHWIELGTVTQPCVFPFDRFQCLKTVPTATVSPPVINNTALKYSIVAKGWDGPEASPNAQRLLTATMVDPSAGDYTLVFDYKW